MDLETHDHSSIHTMASWIATGLVVPFVTMFLGLLSSPWWWWEYLCRPKHCYGLVLLRFSWIAGALLNVIGLLSVLHATGVLGQGPSTLLGMHPWEWLTISYFGTRTGLFVYHMRLGWKKIIQNDWEGFLEVIEESLKAFLQLFGPRIKRFKNKMSIFHFSWLVSVIPCLCVYSMASWVAAPKTQIHCEAVATEAMPCIPPNGATSLINSDGQCCVIKHVTFDFVHVCSGFSGTFLAGYGIIKTVVHITIQYTDGVEGTGLRKCSIQKAESRDLFVDEMMEDKAKAERMTLPDYPPKLLGVDSNLVTKARNRDSQIEQKDEPISDKAPQDVPNAWNRHPLETVSHKDCVSHA